MTAVLQAAVERPQPGYLTHGNASAAPVDRLAHRQGLDVGHRPQRLTSTYFPVLDRPVTFTERGQHDNRQPFEAAVPIGVSLRSTAWASNADRRAACLTDC